MIHLFEFKEKKRRLLFKSLLSFIFLIFLFQIGESNTWSINSAFQYFKGKYIYTTSTSSYYLSSGLQYQSKRWNIGASVPIIAQNNDLVSSSGGMFLPSGHSSQGGISGGMGNGHQGGGMMGGGRLVTDDVTSKIKFGFGDIYLTGQYQLVGDGSPNALWNYGPSLAVSAQIKFPTASKDRNYGTGEFDYGTMFNLAERWKNYAGFLDLGYWLLGDTPEVNYQNPFTYGIGIGRFINNGKFSALLYYQGYSTILENYDPPHQGSIGFYYRTNDKIILSTTAMAGFSDTSPDFGLSVGFNLIL
jgi:hypothetical protein